MTLAFLPGATFAVQRPVFTHSVVLGTNQRDLGRIRDAILY
jgi:hypothetical protein